MDFNFSINKSRKGNPNKTKNANGYLLVGLRSNKGRTINDFISNFELIKQ